MENQKGFPVGVFVFIALAVIAKWGDAPAGVWLLIAILGAGYWTVRSSKGKKVAPQAKPTQNTVSPPPVYKSQSSRDIVKANQEAPRSFAIPSPPSDMKMPARWLSEGESIDVAGIRISGGMIYVGTGLRAGTGGVEPALIDPVKAVSRSKGAFTERLTNYWPNYSDISAEARRAYLLWLADGKKHPAADIGYVFLYFYGLERRAIFDAHTDVAAQADKPAIAAEIRRLIGIYGDQPNSFGGYAHRLLQFIELSSVSGKLYEQPLPELDSSYELPYLLRVALGQTAVDGVGVPTHLALAWVDHEPTISKRTPVRRCAEEFERLFGLKYRQKFGDGLKLSVNRTKLKLSYAAASSGLRSVDGGISLYFGDIPDVSALTGPPKKLQTIVEECATELDAYSRFLGRSPEKKNSLEASLLLPVSLWSEAVRASLNSLKERVIGDVQIMTLLELSQNFNSEEVPNRERLISLVTALESEQICMEPDVLAGAKTPKANEKLVLFHSDATAVESRSTSAYKAALVTLELAAGVASADGDFSVAELDHINASIDKWQHLTPLSQRRLKARARLLMVAPVSLAVLKKKIEPLDSAAKEAIASFSATLVQADGVVSPDEIKFLEKVYKLLDVDTRKVYSDVHQAVTTDSKQAPEKKAEHQTFKLDAARIAVLQQDSAHVAALLSDIFVEDEPVAGAIQIDSSSTDEDIPAGSRVLGLDEAHSAFVRMLMSRMSWSREELNNLALDLDLMLDGALERVNEAALDTFDISLTEGDDPIEVNLDINEKVMQ